MKVRLNAIRDNVSLFKIKEKIEFKRVDAENINELKKLGSKYLNIF